MLSLRPGHLGLVLLARLKDGMFKFMYPKNLRHQLCSFYFYFSSSNSSRSMYVTLNLILPIAEGRALCESKPHADLNVCIALAMKIKEVGLDRRNWCRMITQCDRRMLTWELT